MTTRRNHTLDLPAAFYHDHVWRDLPSGLVVKETARSVTVEMTDEELDDLRSDAALYSDPTGFDVGIGQGDAVSTA